MTVAAVTPVQQYAGNGSATVFSVPFKFLADSDLVVTTTDSSGTVAVLTEGSGYTVSGAGNDNGGSVTLPSALASGLTLTIKRSTAQTQETDFVTANAFLPEIHETAFDRATMLVQDLKQYISDQLAEINNLIGSGGNGTTPDNTFFDLTDNQAAGIGASGHAKAISKGGTLYISENAGMYRAVRRRGLFDVADYGAVGGGADDTSPIQAAINAAAAYGGGTVFFPNFSGGFQVTGLILTSGPGVRFENAGQNVQLAARGPMTAPLLRVQDSDHVEVKGLVFTAGSATGTFDLLHLDGSSYCSIVKCTFLNAKRYGVRFEKVLGASVGSFFNEIRQCRAFNSATANYYSGPAANETHVYGGECQAAPYGWIVDGADNCTGHGASFEGNNTAGIKVGTASNHGVVAAYGCRFEGGNVSQYGVEIGNSLSTFEWFGGLWTSNVVEDIHNPYPTTAYVAGISAGVGTTPSPNARGLQVYAGGRPNSFDGFIIQLIAGAINLTGPSTTNITTLANYLTLSSAGGIVDVVTASLRIIGTYQKPLLFGANSVWVSAGGKLMIKAGALPGSDSDGVVVGSQT